MIWRTKAGAFLAGAILALAVVLACNRLLPSRRALLGMFCAGAALMAVASGVLAAAWKEPGDPSAAPQDDRRKQ